MSGVLVVVIVAAILCWLFATYVSPNRQVTVIVVGIVLVLIVLWLVFGVGVSLPVRTR